VKTSVQTGVVTPQAENAEDPVIACRYFNLQGAEINQPAANAVSIVVKMHFSGKRSAIKIRY
jgi:hypothetical protein